MSITDEFQIMLKDKETYNLVDFLYSYYEDLVYKTYEPEEQRPNESVPKEITLPLEEREYPIKKQLLALLDAGYDFNTLCGEDDYPLMRAVGFLDAPMTEFMIAHGADPFLYPDADDLHWGNYYFEDLDITAMHEGFANDADRGVLDAVMKVAIVLGRAGVRGQGNCLTIQDHEVTLNGPKMKY